MGSACCAPDVAAEGPKSLLAVNKPLHDLVTLEAAQRKDVEKQIATEGKTLSIVALQFTETNARNAIWRCYRFGLPKFVLLELWEDVLRQCIDLHFRCFAECPYSAAPILHPDTSQDIQTVALDHVARGDPRHVVSTDGCSPVAPVSPSNGRWNSSTVGSGVISPAMEIDDFTGQRSHRILSPTPPGEDMSWTRGGDSVRAISNGPEMQLQKQHIADLEHVYVELHDTLEKRIREKDRVHAEELMRRDEQIAELRLLCSELSEELRASQSRHREEESDVPRQIHSEPNDHRPHCEKWSANGSLPSDSPTASCRVTSPLREALQPPVRWWGVPQVERRLTSLSVLDELTCHPTIDL